MIREISIEVDNEDGNLIRIAYLFKNKFAYCEYSLKTQYEFFEVESKKSKKYISQKKYIEECQNREKAYLKFFANNTMYKFKLYRNK